jgi:hypothetical protein
VSTKAFKLLHRTIIEDIFHRKGKNNGTRLAMVDCKNTKLLTRLITIVCLARAMAIRVNSCALTAALVISSTTASSAMMGTDVEVQLRENRENSYSIQIGKYFNSKQGNW